MQRDKTTDKTRDADKAPERENSKQEPRTTLASKAADSSRRVEEKVEEPIFLTERQLAARHQKSVRTIRNLRVSGGYIPYVKIGRHVRYRLADVLAYEKSNMKRFTSDEGGDHA